MKGICLLACLPKKTDTKLCAATTHTQPTHMELKRGELSHICVCVCVCAVENGKEHWATVTSRNARIKEQKKVFCFRSPSFCSHFECHFMRGSWPKSVGKVYLIQLWYDLRTKRWCTDNSKRLRNVRRNGKADCKQ